MGMGKINMFLLRRSERKSATRVRQVYVSSASRRKSSDCKDGEEDSTISPVCTTSHSNASETPSSSKRTKHVKWADNVEANSSTTCADLVARPYDGTKETYYRDKIRRRVLNGSCPGCSQCPQNIYKILHDADMFCDMEVNKIRAARCLVPIDWTDRSDCIPILPFDKLLSLCTPQAPNSMRYPLWAHFCFNFWIRYDHDIRIEPLIYWRPFNSISTVISTSSSDVSSCGSMSQFSHTSLQVPEESTASDSPSGNALVLKSSGEIVAYSNASSWYSRGHLTRSYSWLQRTVAQSHALIRTLLRKPPLHHEMERETDMVEELCTEVLQNEDLRFEIRYLTLEDLITKLERMKSANHRHDLLGSAIDELITYYRACGVSKRSVCPSDCDDSSTSLSSHLQATVNQRAYTTVI